MGRCHTTFYKKQYSKKCLDFQIVFVMKFEILRFLFDEKLEQITKMTFKQV